MGVKNKRMNEICSFTLVMHSWLTAGLVTKKELIMHLNYHVCTCAHDKSHPLMTWKIRLPTCAIYSYHLPQVGIGSPTKVMSHQPLSTINKHHFLNCELPPTISHPQPNTTKTISIIALRSTRQWRIYKTMSHRAFHPSAASSDAFHTDAKKPMSPVET